MNLFSNFGPSGILVPLVLMNRLNKTESAVFLYCRFSLFLKDPFFQIIDYIFIIASLHMIMSSYFRRSQLESEEIVADLVHCFLIPEVKKKTVREKGTFNYLGLVRFIGSAVARW